MEFIPGVFYERPCAIVLTSDGREYATPVFDHLHADPQFGFPHEHYHIDGRFYLEPSIRHEFRLQDGCTNAVIRSHDGEPQFLRIEKRNLECLRQHTGLTFPIEPTDRQLKNLVSYDNWYQSYIGRSCTGKRCPHYGTEMLEKDGLLICPMHHLTADITTLKIIPHGRKVDIYRSVIDGDELLIGNLNIWDHQWKDMRRYVQVKDPIYGQDHVMNIYEISADDRTIVFATGEFSNLIWGIYLLESIERPEGLTLTLRKLT